MTDRGINSGTNTRPLDDTIAGTGPGIADDALTPGEDMPTAPTDQEVARAAEALHAPIPAAEEGEDADPRD